MSCRPVFTGVSCALTIFLAFAAPRPAALADAASEEFNAVRLAHEKAAAAALAHPNAEYKAALEKILQDARQAKNLDLVARAQQALDRSAASPPLLEEAGPKADFIGKWDFLHLDSGVSYPIELKADGSWVQLNDITGGFRAAFVGPGGTWAFSDNQIVINFRAHDNWHDHYDLPIEGGVLQGHGGLGGRMQITRHGVPAPDAVKVEVVGLWQFHISGDNQPRDISIDSDGSYSEAGKRVGYWAVADKRLFVNFDAHENWHDIYDLPVSDDQLHGRNPFGGTLLLTRAEK